MTIKASLNNVAKALQALKEQNKALTNAKSLNYPNMAYVTRK